MRRVILIGLVLGGLFFSCRSEREENYNNANQLFTSNIDMPNWLKGTYVPGKNGKKEADIPKITFSETSEGVLIEFEVMGTGRYNNYKGKINRNIFILREYKPYVVSERVDNGSGFVTISSFVKGQGYIVLKIDRDEYGDVTMDMDIPFGSKMLGSEDLKRDIADWNDIKQSFTIPDSKYTATRLIFTKLK